MLSGEIKIGEVIPLDMREEKEGKLVGGGREQELQKQPVYHTQAGREDRYDSKAPESSSF